MLESNGLLAVSGGGTTADVTILSGGTEIVFSAGAAIDVVIGSGGTAILGSHGTASISGATNGFILASGKGAIVDLDGAAISGGLLQGVSSGQIDVIGSDNALNGTRIKGLMIIASGATAALSGGILSAGAIVEILSGATLLVSRTISNGGTLFADEAGSLIEIVSGAVINGGVVEIGDGIVEVKSGGTANVTFRSTGTGGLLISDDKDHPTAYNGKISGFGGTSHNISSQFIDLVSVTSAAGVSASFTSAASHTSGVLTITSGGSTVAQINLIGHYITSNFQIVADSSGHVEITDPAAPNPYAAKAALFGNYIAGFTAAGGIAGGALISAPTEGHVLAPPHHA